MIINIIGEEVAEEQAAYFMMARILSLRLRIRLLSGQAAREAPIQDTRATMVVTQSSIH
jgi:hypothetical protein